MQRKEIKGLAVRNKDNMIRDLVEHMLKPKVMWAYFACMWEDEIQEFEKAANSGEWYEPENIKNLLKLYEAGYIGMIDDGRVMIPSDVIRAYRNFNKDVFWEDQKKMSYLLCCLETLGILYGMAPMSILLKHNIIPFIIDETHKLYYYRGLKEFHSEKGYLMDTCLSAQDRYKEMLDYFMPDI